VAAGAGAPALVNVTLETVSPPTSPELVNSVPAKTKVLPCVLLWLVAVMARLAGVMSAVRPPGCTTT
jgi:hypothetical protein